MKLIDRLCIIALVLGVWALVLKPESPTAHSGQICTITSGEGFGEVNGREVYVYDITGSVMCF